MNCNKLILGGAQFGMNYGATNKVGQTDITTLRSILAFAESKKISLIDTAPAYGNSETLLGEVDAGKSFRFITKTILSKTQTSVTDLICQFETSLESLKVGSIEVLLFHNPDILLQRQGASLYRAALKLKLKGLCKKIGVSVYDKSQIYNIFQNFKFDVVQLPFNVIDDRLLVSGALDYLKDNRVEVHARSVFLQGLLLKSPDELAPKFMKFKPILKNFRQQLDAAGVTPMQACIGTLQSLKQIDHIVVGVTSVAELAEIVDAQNYDFAPHNFNNVLTSDVSILDPRLWE